MLLNFCVWGLRKNECHLIECVFSELITNFPNCIPTLQLPRPRPPLTGVSRHTAARFVMTSTLR